MHNDHDYEKYQSWVPGWVIINRKVEMNLVHHLEGQF